MKKIEFKYLLIAVCVGVFFSMVVGDAFAARSKKF